jgi:hypothetical protein
MGVWTLICSSSGEEAALLIRVTLRVTLPSLIRVLVVDSTRQLARIRRVSDRTMLPIFIVPEAAVKVHGVVDVSEAEFNVVVLLASVASRLALETTNTACSLALLDPIDVPWNLLFSARKLEKGVV